MSDPVSASVSPTKAPPPLDVDALYITRTVVNEGPKLKRFMPAAMGRATPIAKRTSHIEIELAEKTGKAAKAGRKR